MHKLLGYSKFYRVSLYFILLLIIIVISLLYFLIPIWGITGAAIAIAGALFLNNIMRYLFLLQKYKLQPFNYKFLLIAAFFTCIYFILLLIPQQQIIWDILTRGMFISIGTGIFMMLVPVSSDIKEIGLKLLKKFNSGNE